ncbi:hypothetical protein GOD90_20280 [Sinorhizobium medicae]|nr:hypothetical protein [Sinorhizobium medicae]MDX0899293.1 hypothetical protein [Sinorhizobium medicae]MDX1120225.1 hypothetical protein [Sinorhizobium medicae]MDX1242708.1 hypothetical protein [Sinorhizobium medicae]
MNKDIETNAVSIRLTVLGKHPDIRIEVRNISQLPIWLVGVLDGSEAGARFPKWIPHISGPKGELSPPESPDFTSPLRAADFRRLAPGESFDPTLPVDGAAYFPIAAFERLSDEAGDYSVTLELDTSASTPAAWMGTLPDRRPQAESEAGEVVRRINEIPPMKVRSNTLLITGP